jgi:hypothetical protein
MAHRSGSCRNWLSAGFYLHNEYPCTRCENLRATMHQAPFTGQTMFQKHFHGCTRVLGTTRCNSNVLLLLHGIGSTRAGSALSTFAALCLRRYGALARKASVKRKLANHTIASRPPNDSGRTARDARLDVTE